MEKKSYYQNLIKSVIEASESDIWEEAVQEWEIFDCEEDDTCSSECICKHEGLKYLYTIRNDNNGNILFPIGSSCIKKFGRDDLDEEIAIKEKMFSLFHAVEKHERIELSAKYFSKKLLYYFYENDVFKPNQYNHFDGYNDYEFLLKMFRKTNKSDITEAQHRKIRALIVNSILPYLRSELKFRKV